VYGQVYFVKQVADSSCISKTLHILVVILNGIMDLCSPEFEAMGGL
jgi:hypothetical protein